MTPVSSFLSVARPPTVTSSMLQRAGRRRRTPPTSRAIEPKSSRHGLPLWLAARFFIRTKPPNLGQIVVVQLLLLTAVPAGATQYFDLGLHGRVQASDIVVLGRVVDPALA